MKKTFFYNLFPSKEEEAACKLDNTPWVGTQELVEIRDLYPSSIIDLENPWKIKRKITHDEIVQGMLAISFFEIFEYILRYWILDMAKSLVVNRGVVRVALWDVTEENIPKKYEGRSVCLRKLNNDDYSLSCIELFNHRGLGAVDEVGLYWDTRSASLMLKVLSQVRLVKGPRL